MSSEFKLTLAAILVVAGIIFYFLLSPPNPKLSAEEEARALGSLKPVATHAK